MNKDTKYKVVLIEPSEIVATGIAEIINRNPEFSVVQILNTPTYYNANNNDIDIIIINPTVIDYNEGSTYAHTSAEPTAHWWHWHTATTKRMYCANTMTA